MVDLYFDGIRFGGLGYLLRLVESFGRLLLRLLVLSPGCQYAEGGVG
jgi:hypothetical protein